jgi:anti-sigma B factor antagonist
VCLWCGGVAIAGYSIEIMQLQDDVSLLRMSGDADLYAAPELKERLLGAVRAGRTRWLFDLSDVGFIDSTAFGILVQARKLGASIHVLCPDPAIARTFAIVGLDGVLAVHRSLAEASAALGLSDAVHP